MSTQIKNTLYRFVTMRAPELIEKERIVKGFVLFPDVFAEVSDFLKAVSPLPSGKTKATALKDAAKTFWANESYYKDKAALALEVGDELFNYAVWLTKNRASFSVLDVTKKTQALSNAVLERYVAKEAKIWDNLFFQIITSKSSYVREAILSVMVASFFIKNFKPEIVDLEELRTLAQARVILPKKLFGPEDNSEAISEATKKIDDLPFNEKVVEKTTELLVIQNRKSELETIQNELTLIEKKFNVINQNELKKYNKMFNELVNDAYATATKTVKTYTNPVTGIETEETSYENLELPEYNFIPKDPLAYFTTVDYESSIFYPLLKYCKDDLLYTSFQEVKSFLDDRMNALTNELFKRVAITQKVANVNGVAISTNNNSGNAARIVAGFKFLSLASPSYPNKLLALTFAGMEPGTDIITGDYILTFSNNTTIHGVYQNQNSSSEWINGQLVLKIFNYAGHYFTPNLKGGVTLTGTFKSSTGRDLIINGDGIISQVTSGYSSDIFNVFDDLGYNPSNTVTYNTRGIGRYSFEDLVSGSSGASGTNDSGSEVSSGGNSGSSGSSGSSENSGSSQGTNSGNSVIDYVPSGYGIKRLGIADYRKVEQEVCCYVPGEVSHIENVMAREYKEKSTRRMRRQEDTITTSKEKETEKLSDSTTTDRFEMNQEVSSVMAEDTHLGAQTSFGAHWGTGGPKYDLSVGADFAHNTSQETSDHQAVTNAKEITERVLDRVVQKVKEERITKIIEEYEETSKHGYDNRKGDRHISGVYRWVDKIYRNQVINYGKRLMYEFMIPEPATFHNLAIERKIDDNGVEVLEKPIDPRTADTSVRLLLNSNFETHYKYWATVYNAEVEAMPALKIYCSKSLYIEKTAPKEESVSKSDSVKIDDGYIAVKAKASIAGHYDTSGQLHVISVLFGDTSENTNSNLKGVFPTDYQAINNFKGEVPISVQYYNYHTGCVNVSVECVLSDEARLQWQIETFNTIINAYEDRLKEYNNKMAELKGMHIEKIKTNPLFYRQIENMVLRKNCIEYMISHDALGGTPLIEGSDFVDTRVMYESVALEAYAAKVKFFEQAFEWNLMSYNFYPFYWAKRTRWQDLYNVDEVDDPLFRSFLQSGMGRVIVTVRPGFEEAVNWYMGTGQVWNGGQVPTLNDPLFISIIQELRQPEGAVEETWESRVPTSLTVIQAGTIGLNVEGLPCDDECADYKMFDSDGHPVLNPDGTLKSSNPIKQSVDDEGNPINLGNITDDLETVSDSIEEIKADIEQIKTTLEGISSGN